MAWKSANQLDAEKTELLEAWDEACEAAFRSAQRVRECPDCEEGWVYIRVWNETYEREYDSVERCHCWEPHKKNLRAMRYAKDNYRRIHECDPPEPDRHRLEV